MMKLITFSDLHLEFNPNFALPASSEADVMVLAGDIMTFANYQPFARFLKTWRKPVIYIAGNHEFYTNTAMTVEIEKFAKWLAEAHPNVHFLYDSAVTIDGIHFFGGTMWTDFQDGSQDAMLNAANAIKDFKWIRQANGNRLTPTSTTQLHAQFIAKLRAWFEQTSSARRVVVTHHAPVINPQTKYTNSPLTPAFSATDVTTIIDTYQPTLWIYGHTHECDNHFRGRTRILSNQRGYQYHTLGYECQGQFDPSGSLVEL